MTISYPSEVLGPRRMSMVYYIPIAGVIAVSLYFFSYYGWVRKVHSPQGPQTIYSLDYSHVPVRGLASVLEWLHTPLRTVDARRNTRLYDTPSPAFPPELFNNVPDFKVNSTGSAESDGS